MGVPVTYMIGLQLPVFHRINKSRKCVVTALSQFVIEPKHQLRKTKRRTEREGEKQGEGGIGCQQINRKSDTKAELPKNYIL